MENMKIRMFRDGTSVVIYIDDCDASMEDFLKNLLKPAIAPESRLEEAPAVAEEPVIPEGWGSISGKTITEVLQDMGLKGYANIRYILDKAEEGKRKLFKPSEKSEVETILREYLHETFSTIDADTYALNLDENGCNEFLKIFDSIIDETSRLKAKNICGCSSYEEFCSSGTLEQKKMFIPSVIDIIKNNN
jgi:hypothetical protein